MSITKIIFLDIDGVLNSQLFYTSGRHSTRRAEFRNDIDPESVKLLNELIKETGAKVVVTSTWRQGRSIEELQSILEHNEFVGEVIGKTDNLRSEHCLRGNEILKWIKDNENIVGCSYSDYRHYIILDDDSDMLYWQRNNLFLTDGYCGLTPNLVYKASRFLNS